MIGPDSDEAVLAYLREAGPGTVSVRRLARETGLPRVTVQASLFALTVEGLICTLTDPGESLFMIRHVHAAPGHCGHSLGCTVSEDPE